MPHACSSLTILSLSSTMRRSSTWLVNGGGGPAGGGGCTRVVAAVAGGRGGKIASIAALSMAVAGARVGLVEEAHGPSRLASMSHRDHEAEPGRHHLVVGRPGRPGRRHWQLAPIQSLVVLPKAGTMIVTTS